MHQVLYNYELLCRYIASNPKAATFLEVQILLIDFKTADLSQYTWPFLQ